MSPADRAIVAQFSKVRFATRRQLTALLPGSGSSLADARRAQRRLVSLEQRRIVARHQRPVGGRAGGSEGPIYSLDVVGQRVIDADAVRRLRRPWIVSEPFVRHALAVTDVYVELVAAADHGVLELLDFVGEPDCWRRVSDSAGGVRLLKPDAYARVARGEWEYEAFLEIDLATESASAVRRKASAYSDAYQATALDVFPAVIWLTSTSRRAAMLTETLSSLPAEQWRLHRVGLLGAAPIAIAGQVPT